MTTDSLMAAIDSYLAPFVLNIRQIIVEKCDICKHVLNPFPVMFIALMESSLSSVENQVCK